MSFLSSIGQNSALYSINNTQSGLLNSYTKLSSGKAINSAADNPSGLAIYQSLTAQANGYDQGARNAQDAVNALTVAQGGLSTVTDALQTLNTLAVKANNGFLSPAQAGYIQTEVNAVSQQINTVAQVTQFNGTSLLNGSVAGPQPGNPPAVTTPSNDVLAGGGQVVSGVAANSPNFFNSNGPAQGFGGTSTTDSTIQITIVNNNGVAAAQVTATDSATGTTVTSATLTASGGVANQFENLNVQLGNFTLADVGQTATLQVQQANAATNTGNALNVQTGPNAGNNIQVAIPSVNTATLQVSNLQVGTQAGATNAQGQISAALQSVLQTQAQVGAQQVAAQYDIQAANNASVNLTSSASRIADLNYGSETTHNNNLNLLSNIGLNVLAKLNASHGYLTGLFNQAA